MKRLFKYGEAQHIPGIAMADITEIVLDEVSSLLTEILEKLEKEREKLKGYPMWNEFVKGENEGLDTSIQIITTLIKENEI